MSAPTYIKERISAYVVYLITMRTVRVRALAKITEENILQIVGL